MPYDKYLWGGNLEPKIMEEPIIYDDYNGRIKADQSVIGTLTTNFGNDAERNGVKIIEPLQNYRIRKLTPKECFRLMGVKDEDYEKVAKNQSNSSLYHLAGDSIVVNVLMALFNQIDKTGLYWDANVSRQINFGSDWAIPDIKKDSELRANEMHEKVVQELMEKIKVQEK